MSKQTTLPVEYSIRDLPEFLAKKKPLPPLMESLLKQAAKRLSGARPNKQHLWEDTLGFIETALKTGDMDCALGLLCSREYLKTLVYSEGSSTYQKKLKLLFKNYPDLKLNYDRALELITAISARSSNSTATALDAIRSALANAQSMNSSARLAVTEQLMILGSSYLPEHDASHGWDWTDSDWFQKRSLETPWWSSNNMGVDVTLDKCLAEEGWELYIRRILNSDGLTLPLPAGFEEGVMPNQKYFALYNLRTGLLRMFVYATAPVAPSDSLLALAYCSEGAESNPVDTHGLFNNLGPICYTLQQSNALEENQIRFCSTWVQAGWLVLDFPLAFDSSMLQRGPFFLNVFVKGVTVASINLEGCFKTKTQIDNPDPSLFEKIGKLFGALMGFSDAAKDVSAVGNKVKSLGTSIASKGGDGTALISLGTAILNATGLLAGLIGGTQLIRTMMRLGDSSGGIKYAYHEGSVSLKGNATLIGTNTFAAILLNQSKLVDSGEIPYFYKKHYCSPSRGPFINAVQALSKDALKWPYRSGLGTFNLTRLPEVFVHVYHSPHTVSDHPGRGGHFRFFTKVTVESIDLKSLVMMNPNWPVALDKVQLQIVMQRVAWWPQHENMKLASGTEKEVILQEQKITPPSVVAPASVNVVDVFYPGFQDPNFYIQRLFITDASANSRLIDQLNPIVRVFARLQYTFHVLDVPGPASLEWVNTYHCTPSFKHSYGFDLGKFPI